jgi:hypothetical protein
MNKNDWKNLPSGTKLRCIKGYSDRITEGKEYELECVNISFDETISIWIKKCDLGHCCNWGKIRNDGTHEHFEVVSPSTEVSLEDLVAEFQKAEELYNKKSIEAANAQDYLDSVVEALKDRLSLS